MKFLLDENISKKVAQYLKQLGHSTTRIREKFPGIPDYRVLEISNDKNLILITADKDFGELIFKSGYTSQSIILLRLKDQTSENSIKALRKVLDRDGSKITGNFVVITKTMKGFRIRLRRL